MVWWQAALWALAGGFVVEGLEFAALQRRHHKWPWQVDAEALASNPPPGDTADNTAAAGPLGYFIAELIRLAAGGLLGAAMAGQITAPLPALAIGAAAPIVAGNLGAYIPLLTGAPQPAPDTPATTAPALIDTTSPGQTGLARRAVSPDAVPTGNGSLVDTITGPDRRETDPPMPAQASQRPSRGRHGEAT